MCTENMIARLHEKDLSTWIKNVFGQFQAYFWILLLSYRNFNPFLINICWIKFQNNQKQRSPKATLLVYKVAQSKVHPNSDLLSVSSKAAALNNLIEDLCPNHALSQDLPVSIKQSNYYERVKENCYCAKPRDAGNFKTLQLIQKNHLKCMKNFYVGFRFTSTPYGISV